jgi:hypothetical protein
MGEWQKIESAPTDCEFLSWSALDGFYIAYWSTWSTDGFREHQEGLPIHPTHWMPLPPPPEQPHD